MPDTSNISKNNKESSLLSFFKGLGCFFVLMVFAFSIFATVGYFIFYPIVRAVRIEEKLPDFEGPTEQDFWSLQEKLLVKDKSKDFNDLKSLNLTNGQFNAFLSSIHTPPIQGFCLFKVRHFYKDNKIRYYLIGSGYFLKKLVISFYATKEGISDLNLNSWKVPSNSFMEKYVKSLVKSITLEDKSGILEKIISGNINPFE